MFDDQEKPLGKFIPLEPSISLHNELFSKFSLLKRLHSS
jgi:hypothetical protein